MRTKVKKHIIQKIYVHHYTYTHPFPYFIDPNIGGKDMMHNWLMHCSVVDDRRKHCIVDNNAVVVVEVVDFAIVADGVELDFVDFVSQIGLAQFDYHLGQQMSLDGQVMDQQVCCYHIVCTHCPSCLSWPY